MRYLFACLFMMLALPAAAAQPSAACKGKPTYSLSDGSIWCLMHSDKTSITSTLSRDDGNSKSSSNRAHIFVVAMNGAFSRRMGTSEKRMKEICQVMRSKSPELFTGNARNRDIVVSMLWPEKAAAEGYQQLDHRFPNQAAGMTKKCSALRHFGTRSR